ncbi:MAG: M28 family peptidase [Mariniblastus sp.]
MRSGIKESSAYSRNNRGIALVLALLSWLTIVWLGDYFYAPVKPRESHAEKTDSQSTFSSARAEAILESLVGDSIPHPAGSKQNTIVREKIVALLESYGYSVEIQTGKASVDDWLRDRNGGQKEVELNNIYAFKNLTLTGLAPTGSASSESSDPPDSSGTSNYESDKSILLLSHYDSTSRGPGASDDGVGTAALIEIARMIAEEPVDGRDVKFLITDGEELGLLGAKLFIDEHPDAKNTGVVINLEARGTTGPSMMFETSSFSRQLIPVFARTSTRPFASSLFFEIYKRMPNDTDFTVFREAGILGYNFAFIGDVKNYHTPTDNFDNFDRGSLQHHGENALGLIRGLRNSRELETALTLKANLNGSNPAVSKAAHEAVYFDFFGMFLIWWPSDWSVWLVLVATILFGLSATVFPKDQELNKSKLSPPLASRFQQLLAGLIIHVAAILVLSVCLYFIQYGVRLDSRLSNPWPRQPVPIILGYGLASCALVGLVTLVGEKFLTPKGAWLGFGLIWLGMALLSSLLVTGASYLFIVPILGVSILGICMNRLGDRGIWLTILSTTIFVGLIWLPMERLFYDGVGFKLPIAMLFRFSMLATALVTLLSLENKQVKFTFSLATSIAAVVSLVAAIVMNTEGP